MGGKGDGISLKYEGKITQTPMFEVLPLLSFSLLITVR